MYGFKFCNRQAFKQQQKNRKKSFMSLQSYVYKIWLIFYLDNS